MTNNKRISRILWNTYRSETAARTRFLRARIARTIAPEMARTADDAAMHLSHIIYQRDNFEDRYGERGGCGGCFDAVMEYGKYTPRTLKQEPERPYTEREKDLMKAGIDICDWSLNGSRP